MTTHNCLTPIEVGDYMEAATIAYRVTESRLVKGHSDKWRLVCLRCYKDEVPKGATVHGIRWFSRSKKQK